MFCTNCGKELKEGSVFCRYCGTKVKKPANTEAVPAPPAEPADPQPVPAPPAEPPVPQAVRPAKKSRGPVIMIAVVAVLAVAGIAAGGILLAQRQQNRADELLAAQEQLEQAQQEAASAQEQLEQAQAQIEQAEQQRQQAQQQAEQAQQQMEQAQAEAAKQAEQQTSAVSALRRQAEAELAQVEQQSAQLEAQLESAIDQVSLNRYSGQLFTLWDEEINVLWAHLKNSMGEERFDALTEEQIDWIVAKEDAIEAAGNEVSGGSMAPMARSLTGYEWTRDRVYYLMDYLP